MGYYATCDVKGCDQIAPIHRFGDHPQDWLRLAFEVDEKEKVEALKKSRLRGPLRPGPLPLPRPSVADGEDPTDDPTNEVFDTFRVSRSVLMCPAHEMPEFDPEPEGMPLGPILIGAQ